MSIGNEIFGFRKLTGTEQWHKEYISEDSVPSGYRPLLLLEVVEIGDMVWDCPPGRFTSGRLTHSLNIGIPAESHQTLKLTKRPLPNTQPPTELAIEQLFLKMEKLPKTVDSDLGVYRFRDEIFFSNLDGKPPRVDRKRPLRVILRSDLVKSLINDYSAFEDRPARPVGNWRWDFNGTFGDPRDGGGSDIVAWKYEEQ